MYYVCISGIIVFYLGDNSTSLEFKSHPGSYYIDKLAECAPGSLFLAYTAHAVQLINTGEYVKARDEYLLPGICSLKPKASLREILPLQLKCVV